MVLVVVHIELVGNPSVKVSAISNKRMIRREARPKLNWRANAITADKPHSGDLKWDLNE